MEWDPGSRSAGQMYQFLTSAIAPRPIAWVTTVGAAGVVNCAPFSWFNAVCAAPPLVMVSFGPRKDGTPKDTLRNIRDTGELVVNVVPRALAEPMVRTSASFSPEVSEVEAVGLRTLPSAKVRPPRLADSPVHLECVLHQEIPLSPGNALVLARIVHVAADDAALDARGNVDPARVTLVARMGGATYTESSVRFELPWPAQPDALRG